MKNVMRQIPLNTTTKKMFRYIASSILCALILHILAVRASALDVQLQWDTNDEAAYYVIHYGTGSQNYTEESEPINAPQTQYTVSGLTSTTWYFAVKAFNSCGNSSGFSDEVVYTPTTTTPDPLVADIGSPALDVSITAGDSINFQGNVQGGLPPYSYSWYFGAGGPAGSSQQNPGNVTFADAGVYNVEYTVDDDNGSSSQATVRITVSSTYVDVTTHAAITSPASDVTITEGQSVNFQVSVTSGNAPFNHTWNFGAGGPANQNVEDPGNVTFHNAGTYTVTYTITDNDGDTSSDTVIVTVKALYVDVNPTVSISSPISNVTITEGQSVNFQASVSSGNAPFTHVWNFGYDGPANQTVEDPGNVTFPTAGSFTVTYTITDNDGDTSSDTVVVTVKAIYVDVNPTASISSPSANMAITEGESVNFQGSVSSGNATFTHSWNFGTHGPAGQNVEDPGNVTFDSAGTYTITYTVTDNDGDTSSDTVVLTVKALYVDVNPTASITSPITDVTINEGESVNFQGSVSSGNAPFTHAWSFGSNGPTYQSVEDPSNVTFPAAGTYTVTYSVTDNDGDTNSDTMLVTVKALYIDVEPVVSITSPVSNQIFTEGDSVNFQGNISGGNAPFKHAWSFGSNGPSGQAVEDPGNITFIYAGTYSATYTVIDNDGDVKSATVTFKVEQAVETPIEQPGIISPSNDTVVSLTPELVAAVDTTDGDTQWQISNDSTFSNQVLNVTSNNKKSIRVPGLILDGTTQYFWRIKKRSSKGVSDWSEPQSFTTEAIEWNDNDGNGVSDDQEAPIGMDLNNDGIEDSNQPDTIISVKAMIGRGSIGLIKMDHVVDIEVLESFATDSITDTTGMPDELPSGLIGFRVLVENPGDTVKIGVCLSEAAPQGAGWYKYDSITGWQNYTAHTTFSADRKMITVELTDGGEGDADGCVNGIIVDPSGIGLNFSSALPALSIGGPGAEQGCFISGAGQGNASILQWIGIMILIFVSFAGMEIKKTYF